MRDGVVQRLLLPGLAVAAAAAGLLLWGGPAGASHSSGTLHVCAVEGAGTLRVGEDCTALESAHVLVTEAGLQAAEARIADLEYTVATLEADLAAATGRIDTLEGDLAAATVRIDTLKGKVASLEATLAGVTRTGDTLTFSGTNVQIVNGQGATDTTNGLGNLIVGYNEDHTCTPPGVGNCPFFSDVTADQRTGSHMVVVGVDHTWTSFGGLLAGVNSTASGDWASVAGGRNNSASGLFASVTGGNRNTASGRYASVTGGEGNSASHDFASVAGGGNNTASAIGASVAGGFGNTASRTSASVAGGSGNTASGSVASVSGGFGNTASGLFTSVAGGEGGTVTGDYDSLIGDTLFEDGN